MLITQKYSPVIKLINSNDIIENTATTTVLNLTCINSAFTGSMWLKRKSGWRLSTQSSRVRRPYMKIASVMNYDNYSSIILANQISYKYH